MERSEARIQQEMVMWFRADYCLKLHDPQMIIFSVPNESENVREQMKKKATGLLSGVSDLIIVLPGKTIFVEVKDSKGRQKPNQVKFEEKIKALQQEYWLVRSLKEFQMRVKEELNKDL